MCHQKSSCPQQPNVFGVFREHRPILFIIRFSAPCAAPQHPKKKKSKKQAVFHLCRMRRHCERGGVMQCSLCFFSGQLLLVYPTNRSNTLYSHQWRCDSSGLLYSLCPAKLSGMWKKSLLLLSCLPVAPAPKLPSALTSLLPMSNRILLQLSLSKPKWLVGSHKAECRRYVGGKKVKLIFFCWRQWWTWICVRKWGRRRRWKSSMEETSEWEEMEETA